MWAVCTGFFGFLWSREFTAPEKEEFDSGVHLPFKDIDVDNATDPRVTSVRIKQSKMDSFRQGVTIFLGWIDVLICPVAAHLAYLARRGSGDGPLFHFENEQPLTSSRLVMEVRKALREAGL